MQFAIDKSGNRINAYDASEYNTYKCPTCSGEVILRCGEINIWHFAHKACECIDRWNYDMSEWHQKMQGYFDKEHQEVVVRHNEEIHRADILKDGVVIEFQHSPISASEFMERNKFYKNAGYKLVWVFDVCDDYESGKLKEINEDDYNTLRWKNPLRILKTAPPPQNNSKEFAIHICRACIDYDDNDNEIIRHYINKINWSSLDDYDNPDYRFIKIFDNESIDADSIKDDNIEKLFWTPYDFVKNHTKNLPHYEIKYSGERGHAYNDYICPISKDWLNLDKCEHCGHCGLNIQSYDKKNDKIINKYYCCYPKIVNEKVPDDVRAISGNEYKQVYSMTI